MNYQNVLGPYERRDGRSHVVVKLQNGKYRTISYPRFLLEKKLGRCLDNWEEVHHVDGNFRNNQLDNLKVIHCASHAASHAVKPERWIKFECPTCKHTSQKDYRNVKANWKKGRSGPFCSKSCASRYPEFTGKSKIVEVSVSLKGEIF